MRISKLNKIIASFLTLFACFSIGYGSWNIHAEKSYSVGEKGDNPVAYIKNGISKTYYIKLEKAVEAANNSDSKKSPIDVWVIPNTKYTVTSSFTIDEYVTLNLPFQGELNFGVYKTKNGVYDPSGADTATGVKAIDNPDTYRRTKLTLSSGVTITNNGTINVGGVIGGVGGGQEGACGQTCYYYSEIYCMGNSDGTAQIINNKLIKSQGNISGVSSQIFALENKANATFKSPFVVEENYGGSALVALGGGYLSAGLDILSFECSPFNRIYMPNVTAKVQCDSGSFVYGLAAMYGNDTHNQVEVNIFGNKNTYFVQSNGGYLTSYFSNGCQTIDFYGDIGFNYLEMKISAKGLERSVKTDTVLFPISYVNDVRFHSINGALANVSSTQDMKILPGGKLFVDENVKFSAKQLAVYDSTFEDPASGPVRYPKLNVDGIFKVSGAASIENFGGYVTIGKADASIEITGMPAVSSKQIEGDPGKAQYKRMTFFSNGVISTDNGANLKNTNLKNGIIFYSHLNSSGKYYWSSQSDWCGIAIYSVGHRKGLIYFPRFEVYVANDSSGSGEKKIGELCQTTDTTVELRKPDTFFNAASVIRGSYIKIKEVKSCNNISNAVLGVYFQVNNDLVVTITRTTMW